MTKTTIRGGTIVIKFCLKCNLDELWIDSDVWKIQTSKLNKSMKAKSLGFGLENLGADFTV